MPQRTQSHSVAIQPVHKSSYAPGSTALADITESKALVDPTTRSRSHTIINQEGPGGGSLTVLNPPGGLHQSTGFANTRKSILIYDINAAQLQGNACGHYASVAKESALKQSGKYV